MANDADDKFHKGKKAIKDDMARREETTEADRTAISELEKERERADRADKNNGKGG